MDIEQMRIRMGEMAAEIERMQSIIDEQQSPAVAVPENKDREMLITLMSAFDTEHSICESCGHQEETMFMDSANMLRQYLQDSPSPSPRITEQDAREIVESFGASLVGMPLTYDHVDIWLKEKGRALLTKLNDKSELELLC